MNELSTAEDHRQLPRIIRSCRVSSAVAEDHQKLPRFIGSCRGTSAVAENHQKLKSMKQDAIGLLVVEKTKFIPNQGLNELIGNQFIQSLQSVHVHRGVVEQHAKAV